MSNESSSRSEAAKPQSSYAPLTREQIEALRPQYDADKSRFVRVGIEVGELHALCDMALNAFLYAEEIERHLTAARSELRTPSEYAIKTAKQILMDDMRAGIRGVCPPPLEWQKAVVLAHAVEDAASPSERNSG